MRLASGKARGAAAATAALLLGAAVQMIAVAPAARGEQAIPDEDLLDPPQPRIKGFTAYGGSWQADGGVLQAAGPDGPKLIADGLTLADGEVGVEIRLPDRRGGNAGLIVKVSQPDVGADRFNGYEVSLDAAGQHLRLGRHRQNFENLRDVPCRVPVGEWFPLVVRMTGRSLSISVSGKTVLEYEDRDHPLASGGIGFRPWQREAAFRNLYAATGGRTRPIPLETEPPGPRRTVWPETLRLDVLPPIVLFTRHALSAPPAVGQDLWAAEPRAWGCSIRIVDPAHPGRPVREIFRDSDGCIYDMNLSYDARTLLFSHRKRDDRYWHVWRIGTDGSGLRQLTEGPYYDVSPCPLPDGGVVFVSTRRFGYTLCQPGPASNLHRMSADGGDIRCVSMNTLSDMSPQVLPDGRVLFTRWEYIDRDLTYRQSLWTQNPDGSSYQLYFGNTIRDVGTFWQARPLPGQSDKLVATFAPHHGFPHGAIGLIDRSFGPEGGKGRGFVYLTREIASVGDSRREWAYRDPYPLTDHTFLCAYGGRAERFRICLLDTEGRKRLVYQDPEFCCHDPIPLRPAPVPPVIASRIAPGATLPEAAADSPKGTFLLTDVYRGLEPAIRRGQVKYLRVMEQVRKTEDLAARAFDQSPVMSYGTYYAKRTWGTVPVEADGSVAFTAPALREIYFQVLDEEGRELQRMTSAVQVMPGERVTCIGCHEPREWSPPAARHAPLALMYPPREPERPAWAADGIIDFPGVVQPVLDKYCVRCHRGANPDGGCDLTGDKTRYFSMAYDDLLGRSRSYRQHDMQSGEMLDSERAKGKPLVHFYWLLRTPSAVNQPLWTGCFASRLLDYVDTDHGERAIPREDRQRIYAWIDADVPYYGTYAHSRPRSPGKRDLWTDAATGQLSEWFARDFLGVYNRRCAGCHGGIEGTTNWEGRYAWINLTHPEFSPALTAHLAKAAGGRGIVTPHTGKAPPMFADTSDPDYQAMLRAIAVGTRLAQETPTADMPGFRGAR